MATDQKALSAMSKTGHLRMEHFKQCGVSDKRIRNYEKEGLIERVQMRNSQTKLIENAWKLTEKGKDFYDLKEGREHYHYHSTSATHDVGLSDKYFSLTEKEQETWKTETEIRYEFKEKIEDLRAQGQHQQADRYAELFEERKISTPDAVYTTEDNVEIAFEVITSSYGQVEIAAKVTFATIMQLNYQSLKI